VSTAACIQVAASIPNFALQEYPTGEGVPPKSEIVKEVLECKDGFITIPDRPGIGVELADGAAEKHPFKVRKKHTRLHVDGSVVDQ
jgi:galactonate dehydratase